MNDINEANSENKKNAESERVFSDSKLISASPEEIFALLANPTNHVKLDGSGTLLSMVSEPGPLQLGSKFKMALKRGKHVYALTNTVVEYEPNRRIAWSHILKNRWRFELEPQDDGTLVTETADYTKCRLAKIAIRIQGPDNLAHNITATLNNLAKHFAN
ncbi:MAG: dimethyladenosine transferase [Acidimicrobiia bacterium]|nr:dimethyladenosine transferase [Acidimicrobiia bacterium]MYC56968.1 dimethyladenosine transferase [Acidimicrobiia bacterium]MYG94100.1 dimethyladenosine transferase [Acidimicrobiia bacterium]MYI30833.1 dimethyladenosine transferase [Acidimicrobiia bacterium]